MGSPSRNAKPGPLGDREFDAASMAALFDVTDRTLRLWAERGMPVLDGPQGRPVYPLEAVHWAIVFKVLAGVRRTQGIAIPRTLTMTQVYRHMAEWQARDEPEAFMLVPRDRQHPMRQHMLDSIGAAEKACPRRAKT
jgi:hypothetical protein